MKKHTILILGLPILGLLAYGAFALARTSDPVVLPPAPSAPSASAPVPGHTTPTASVTPTVTAVTPPPIPPATPTSTPTPKPTVRTFTKAELAQHASASSCYTTIEGNVYDVTSYIPLHPGGAAAIQMICGADGSVLFLGQHGGDPKPERTLESRKIGVMVSE